MMDWFHTGFSREFGFGWVYPQIFDDHRRPDAAVQAAHLAWGRERAIRLLGILDHQVLRQRAWLGGERISIADYLGASYLALGEAIRLDYAPYPNIRRWLLAMKARPAWAQTQEPVDTYLVAPYKDTPFVGM